MSPIFCYQDILQEYYQLTTLEEITEIQAQRLYEILKSAETDETLSLLLNEVDEITFHQLGFYEKNSLKNHKNQKAKTKKYIEENSNQTHAISLPNNTLRSETKLIHDVAEGQEVIRERNKVTSLKTTWDKANNSSSLLVNSDNKARVFNQLPQTRLFGTDGIRSKAGELLNANFALQLGYWAGQVLQETATDSGAIIIGQDSRNSSDMLATAISSGLTSAGLEVWHLGLCPTPCVAALTHSLDAMGGIMISASHNYPEDNGIKFFGQDGTKLARQITDEIETRLRANYHNFSTSQLTNNRWGKHYYRPAIIDNYTQRLTRSLPENINFNKLRIVLDLAWGASVEVAPKVFEELGAEVIALHHLPDGDLINLNCGSTHLATLQQAVQEHQADLGFAFDGDADRVMAIDSQGRVVDGNYILYLWGNHLQRHGQLPDNLIIATVMANLGFERAWEKLGGKMTRTAVGDRYVQQEMWRSGAMLGGEQSGNILCHHHGVSGDGIQTALHLTSLVQNSGVSLKELVDNSFQAYPQLLKNVRVEDREVRSSWHQCEPVKQAIYQAETAMGSDGRVLVRALETEPLIQVMVEATDYKLTNYWNKKIFKVIEKEFSHH